MAETSGSLATVVSRRVRDPNNTAHPAVDVRNLFTHAQRIINTHTEGILQASSLAITAGTALIDFSATIPLVDKLLSIRKDNIELPMVPWESLQHANPTWLAARGTPEVWAPIGRTMFALYPAPDRAISMTLVGTKTTASLTSSATTTDLPDRHMPALLNLVEQLLLMRQRLLTSAKVAADRRPFISRGGQV